MFKVSAVPPRRPAVLAVFGGATAINDGTTANHDDHGGATAAYVVHAPQWAYSTGHVPSHTFLLIGRFLQFCIRLVGLPEMKPCEIRKNGRWTQRYCVSNVSTTILSHDLSAPVLLVGWHRGHTWKSSTYEMF